MVAEEITEHWAILVRDETKLPFGPEEEINQWSGGRHMQGPATGPLLSGDGCLSAR